MRKIRVVILLILLIIPSIFILFNASTTTNLTSFENDKDYNQNYYDQNNAPLTSDDSYEDNDVFTQAKNIPKGWYSLMSEDDDWFKIWVENGEELGIETHFVHVFGDLDLELFNSTGFSIAWSMTSNDYENVNWIAQYTGYYYIRIINYAVPNNYDLNIFNTGDKYEINNDFWSASEIYKGYYHLNKRTDDWYKFYCEWGKLQTVDIYFNQTYGDLDLEIYEESNPFLAYIRSDSLTNDESLTFTANYYGFYYIRVYGKTSSVENNYDMKIRGSEITIFQEDFEGAISPKWSGIGGNNYMHLTSRDKSTGSYSLWCGNESSGTYDKKNGSISLPYTESAIINSLNLKEFCYVELIFDANISIGFGEKISLSVSVLGNQYYLNPKYTNNIFEMGGTSDNTIGWETIVIDLSFFCGFEDIDLIFSFEADDFDNNYEGVKLDNILIKGFKDDYILGNSLGISVGNEFYYYFPYIDHYTWSNEIFGKDFYLHSGANIKLEIFSITDEGSYWNIVARFWEPWDDFDELKGTDEIQYRIYKNPLNMKGGNDFFIPSGNVMEYLGRADNYDGYWTATNGYNIEHWYESYWGEYSIEFCYDDFRVHLKYRSNGVLEGMIIHKNFNGERIFEMWRGEPYEDDDEDDEDDEERRAVPGYDPLIIISLVSVVSIIIVKKIKKSKK